LIFVYLENRHWRRFDLEALSRHGQEVEFQKEMSREREIRYGVVLNLINVVLIIEIKHPRNKVRWARSLATMLRYMVGRSVAVY
jgi:hypothetical protein